MSLMEDRQIARDKAKYAKILEGREANVARNIAEGRGITPKGLPISDLTDGANIIKEGGAVIPKAASEVEGASGINPLSLVQNAGGFAKLMPMLGLGAAALGGLHVAKSANEGKLGEAGMEAADVASDFVPGVGLAKFAMNSPELGKGSDEVADKPQFNFDQYKTPTEPEDDETKKLKFAKLGQMLSGNPS